MKRSWDLKPNLLDCILEERIAPAIANLGVIVVTTSGLSLVTPFPGASNNASGCRRHADHGGERERGGDADELLHHGQSRDLVVHAGQLHGQSVGRRGGGRLERGVGLTIQVGSGADQAGGPVSTPASSRTNPASDGATAPIMAYIGSVSSGSGSSTSSMGNGQGTQLQTAPVPSLPPTGVAIPGSPAGDVAGCGHADEPAVRRPAAAQGPGLEPDAGPARRTRRRQPHLAVGSRRILRPPDVQSVPRRAGSATIRPAAFQASSRDERSPGQADSHPRHRPDSPARREPGVRALLLG